jgi:hypothetical protein
MFSIAAQNLLKGFPKARDLERLRASFELAVNPRGTTHHEEEEWVWNSWDDNWTRVVRPLVLPDMYASLDDVYSTDREH